MDKNTKADFENPRSLYKIQKAKKKFIKEEFYLLDDLFHNNYKRGI